MLERLRPSILFLINIDVVNDVVHRLIKVVQERLPVHRRLEDFLSYSMVDKTRVKAAFGDYSL